MICDPPVSAPGQNTGGTHQVVAHHKYELEQMGHKVTVLDGRLLGSIPEGSTAYGHVKQTLEDLQLDSETRIHIVTQGQLGFLSRRYCVEH